MGININVNANVNGNDKDKEKKRKKRKSTFSRFSRGDKNLNHAIRIGIKK